MRVHLGLPAIESTSHVRARNLPLPDFSSSPVPACQTVFIWRLAITRSALRTGFFVLDLAAKEQRARFPFHLRNAEAKVRRLVRQLHPFR